MGNLRFKVGEDLPIILANIAQEKLIYNLDPISAIDVFKDSLRIEDNELIIKLISGKELCGKIDKETESFCVVSREDYPDCQYPILDALGISTGWLDQEISVCLEYSNIFNKPNYSSYFLSNPKSVCLDVDVDLCFLIRVFQGDKDQCKDYIYDTIISRFENREEDFMTEMYSLAEVLVSCKLWFLSVLKKIDVIKFMISSKLLDINDIFIKLNKLEVDIAYLYRHLIDFMSVAELDELTDDYKKEIGGWLKNNKNIQDIISHDILPVDILNGYDAGWLSPSGEFYGMNGEYNDMLHILISDSLKTEGIIPSDVDSPCFWLEENGWVKIHGDWILFNCQDSEFNVTRSMTKEQIDALVEYGKACHNGYLKFGYKMARLNVVTFKYIYLETPTGNDLFSL